RPLDLEALTLEHLHQRLGDGVVVFDKQHPHDYKVPQMLGFVIDTWSDLCRLVPFLDPTTRPRDRPNYLSRSFEAAPRSTQRSMDGTRRRTSGARRSPDDQRRRLARHRREPRTLRLRTAPPRRLPADPAPPHGAARSRG